MSRDRLVVVQLDAVHLDGPHITMATKSLTALALYAEHWPGPMTVAVENKRLPSSPLLTTVPVEDLPFEVVDRARHGVAALRRGAAVTLAMHDVTDPGEIDVEPQRLVLYGEFPLAERIRVGQIGSGPWQRLRVAAGWRRRGRALRAMARRSGGYQSNGYPAHLDYGRLSPHGMIYFDTRATAGILDGAERSRPEESTSTVSPERPFTLGFSGRHTAAKGPEHVLSAVAALHAEGADVHLVLYGSGDLTATLRERASPLGDRVTFRGDLAFETAWVQDVPRTVDLMVLPHVQGDPSGTYLETAAVGVPVLGFDNVALQALVERHDIGWTVPLGDTAALTQKIRDLMEQPALLAAAGRKGRSFMQEHSFEKEFARRVEHLRSVADA